MSIGVLIITYNEEDMIAGCLDSVTWADEVVVVDSNSDDRTRQVVADYTDRIYTRAFDNFSNQRNFGLDKFGSDWILVVDADERVTEKLKEEILSTIEEPEYELYEIPRKNFFLGKWIKYGGWYPDYTPRLFKNNIGINFIGEVHEKPDFAGEAGKIKEPLIHYTYKDISAYMDKVNHYTSLSAEESDKKPTFIYVLIRPLFEFIRIYILKRTFLLGKEGLIMSLIAVISKFLKYLKLWEKKQS